MRSSRGIERHCRGDVASRVITASRAPDHATIARFCVRHERAIAGLFGEVLALCAKAGLVEVGVVAVDGTKIAAAATERATRSYEQIAREILEEAARIDAAEGELYGEARGDELPEGLRSRGDRRQRLREAKQALPGEAELALRRDAQAPPAQHDAMRTGVMDHGSAGGAHVRLTLSARAGASARLAVRLLRTPDVPVGTQAK